MMDDEPNPQGVRTLMQAMLIDAIACLFGRGQPAERRTLVRHARAWIARRDCGFVFSFESVCEELQLDATRLRKMLLRSDPSSACAHAALLKAAHESARSDRVRAALEHARNRPKPTAMSAPRKARRGASRASCGDALPFADAKARG
jgi:hypothetical protein